MVIDALGEPSGSLSGGSTEILYYPLGEVELKDGKVESSTMVTQQEFDERVAEREKVKAQRLEQQAVTRQKRTEAGKAELERVLANESFAKKPAGARLVFWRDFNRKYPGVNVSEHLNTARSEVNAASEKQARLEARLQRLQDELKKPPSGTSSRQARKYRRGRSASKQAEREAALRKEIFGDD